MIRFNQEQLAEYLDAVEKIEDEEERTKYLRAYKNYIFHMNVNNSHLVTYSRKFKDLKSEQKHPVDPIEKELTLLEKRCIAMGLNEEFYSLMDLFSAVIDSEFSKETKRKIVKEMIAEFELDHDLDCFLYDESIELFEKSYNEIIGKKRGR